MRTRPVAALIVVIGFFSSTGCVAEVESDIEEPPAEALGGSLDQVSTATTFCNQQATGNQGTQTVVQNCLYDAAYAE